MAKISSGAIIGDMSHLDLMHRGFPMDVKRDERRCKRCRCFLRPTNGAQHCDPCITAIHQRKGKYEVNMPNTVNPEYQLLRKLRRDLAKLGLKLVKA